MNVADCVNGRLAICMKIIISASFLLNIALAMACVVLYARLIGAVYRVSVQPPAVEVPEFPAEIEKILPNIMNQIGPHLHNPNAFYVVSAGWKEEVFVVEVEPISSLGSEYTIQLDGRTAVFSQISDYFGPHTFSFDKELALMSVEPDP